MFGRILKAFQKQISTFANEFHHLIYADIERALVTNFHFCY